MIVTELTVRCARKGRGWRRDRAGGRRDRGIVSVYAVNPLARARELAFTNSEGFTPNPQDFLFIQGGLEDLREKLRPPRARLIRLCSLVQCGVPVSPVPAFMNFHG